MANFSFEHLHPNQKMAFADGILCGALIAIIGIKLYKDYRQEKDFQKLFAEAAKNRRETTSE